MDMNSPSSAAKGPVPVPWGGKVLQSQVLSPRKNTRHGGKSSYIG